VCLGGKLRFLRTFFTDFVGVLGSETQLGDGFRELIF